MKMTPNIEGHTTSVLLDILGEEWLGLLESEFLVTRTRLVTLVKPKPDPLERPGETAPLHPRRNAARIVYVQNELYVQIFSIDAGTRPELVMDFIQLDPKLYVGPDVRPVFTAAPLRFTWRTKDGEITKPDLSELYREINSYLCFWLY